jgi:hypothetical protein
MSAANGVATTPSTSLRDGWELRNAAAQTLLKSEQQMQRMLQSASVEELVGLIESFSPGRSPGVEWTRTFEPLAERLWAWCKPETMAELEAAFRERGIPWMAVANALSAERGAQLKARRKQPAWARFPAFTLA